jgi:hypothetical protein
VTKTSWELTNSILLFIATQHTCGKVAKALNILMKAVRAFNCEDCQSKESYVDDQVT